MRYLYVMLLILLLLPGCQKQEEAGMSPEPTVKVTPVAATAPAVRNSLFKVALPAEGFELPTQALHSWRQHSGQKPQLVLFSLHPFLQPVPSACADQAKRLTLEGSESDLYTRGSYYRPDPAILSKQTVSAAINAELFSAITWVFPSPQPIESMNLEDFRQQAVEAGFFSAEEAATMTIADLQLTGSVRGTPITVVHPTQLPEIKSPLILHIDLSYFKGLFRDGVKTPVYDLLHDTAVGLRQTGWEPLETTLSYSTEEGELSLDTRFLIEDLKALIRDPAVLDGDMPALWQLRADAMASRIIAQNASALEYYQQANQLAPEQASSHFDLYRLNNRIGNMSQALEHLQQAVKLDKAYGLAYFEQLQPALQNGNLAEADRYHTKIIATAPQNPFFLLQYIELLLSQNRIAEALNHLEMLEQEKWSLHYHPQVPGALQKLKQMAEGTQHSLADYVEKQ